MIKRLRILLKTIVFYVAVTSVFVLAGALADSRNEPVSYLLPTAIAALFSFLLSWLFIKWDGKSLADIGLRYSRHSSWQRLLTGAGLGWAMAFAQATILHALGLLQLVWAPISAQQAIASISLFLIAAVREELVFRGYALQQLAGSWGVWLAQTIMAGIFVMEHVAGGDSWANALIGAGSGALLFGIAALASGGIALPIGIHFAWNSGQWALGFKPQPGLWKAITNHEHQSVANTVGLSVFIAGCLISSILIIFHYRFISPAAPKR